VKEGISTILRHDQSFPTQGLTTPKQEKSSKESMKKRAVIQIN
jgi:hypothetical protein